MEVLNLIRLFWGWVFHGFPLHKPYPYSLYRWGFLHFRYLKSLVTRGTYWTATHPPPGVICCRPSCNWSSKLTASARGWRASACGNVPDRKWSDQRWSDQWIITPRNTPFISRWNNPLILTIYFSTFLSIFHRISQLGLTSFFDLQNIPQTTVKPSRDHGDSLLVGGFLPPIWKICTSEIGSWIPKDRGEHKNWLKPPPCCVDGSEIWVGSNWYGEDM